MVKCHSIESIYIIVDHSNKRKISSENNQTINIQCHIVSIIKSNKGERRLKRVDYKAKLMCGAKHEKNQTEVRIINYLDAE